MDRETRQALIKQSLEELMGHRAGLASQLQRLDLVIELLFAQAGNTEPPEEDSAT